MVTFRRNESSMCLCIVCHTETDESIFNHRIKREQNKTETHTEKKTLKRIHNTSKTTPENIIHLRFGYSFRQFFVESFIRWFDCFWSVHAHRYITISILMWAHKCLVLLWFFSSPFDSTRNKVVTFTRM